LVAFSSLDEVLGEAIDFSCKGSLENLDIKEESEKANMRRMVRF
jgi:hypothetical protein